MVNPEVKQYLISGEIPIEDWSLALQVLGKLGIDAIAVDSSVRHDAEQKVPQGALLEPGTIPYALSEINSREQYLCNEHLGDFWPEYRKQVQESGKIPNKHEALCWGLNMLTHPRPKGRMYRETPSQSAEFVKKLGLVIVIPRSLVGFSDDYSLNAYGLWANEKYGDAVLQVGSFIDASRMLAELPVEDRPFGISATEIRLFNALANKLEGQIEAANRAD